MPELALEGGPEAAAALDVPDWPRVTEADSQNVLDALESGNWCRLSDGAEWVDQFEAEFAEYHDAEHAIAVANGTVAIELALRMLDVQPGDEVLVPAYTFIATASAVTDVGAVPRFVDVDPQTYNVDPESVREQVTDRTVGLIGVHIGGYPMDFDEVLPVVEEHDLFLIEDAAHAQGSAWRGEKVGTIGDVGTFSFQETKALSGGEGGIVVTDDNVLAEKGELYHNIGRVPGHGYWHTELASNLRMSELHGALLCAQIDRLPGENEVRRRNEQVLREELADVEGIHLKPEDDRITSRGYCHFDVQYDADTFGGPDRDTFVEVLNAEGVPASTGYVMPLSDQPGFRRETVQALVPASADVPAYRSLSLPGAETVTERNVSFAHPILLADEDGIRSIGDAVRKIAANVDTIT